VIERFKTVRRPYRVLFHPDGRSYFVSSWADAAVYQYNAINGEEIARLRVGPHATDMVISSYQPEPEDGQSRAAWKYRLFIAAANSNSVYVAGIGDNKTMNLVDTILVSPGPSSFSVSPLGMTPSALTLSADQKHLYVACSDADAVASVDVTTSRGVVEGFFATGAYPAAVRAKGDQVWVAAARGNSVAPLGSAAAALASPLPNTAAPAAHVVYFIRDTHPEALMHAIAGIAPDFTVKMSRRANFDPGDPANTPPAGYLWTNAVAAGIMVQNYGVLLRNGQAIDPGARAFTKPSASAFLDDLKQFETSGSMPRLIVIETGDDQTIETIKAAIAKSRFAKAELVVGDLRRAEALLGLRPMTRKD
jgi:hypothetical protein